jgi:hypothetical protein
VLIESFRVITVLVIHHFHLASWSIVPSGQHRYSDEFLRRQKNIEMLKGGGVITERQTVLPHLLHLSAAERKCYAPFIAHAHLRTRESDTLVKKKTLGMSRIRSYRPSSFVPVSQQGGGVSRTLVSLGVPFF